MVWWWCWLLVTNTVFSVIWLYISLQLSTPPSPDTAQRLHAVYKVPSCTQHPVPATGQVTRHQAEYGPCGYCGRWNIEWIIVWPQNLLSFNFIKGIKKQGYGRWNENHLWMYIGMDTHAHCALVRQWGNEASHVRISVPVLFVVYILTIQSEL